MLINHISRIKKYLTNGIHHSHGTPSHENEIPKVGKREEKKSIQCYVRV
jgi:hypothetical protein